jgi:hypothetical protein
MFSIEVFEIDGNVPSSLPAIAFSILGQSRVLSVIVVEPVMARIALDDVTIMISFLSQDGTNGVDRAFKENPL